MPTKDTQIFETGNLTTSGEKENESLHGSINSENETVSSNSAAAVSNSNYDIRRFRCASYLLAQAAAVGILSGWSVGIFKLLTDTVKHLAYGGGTSTAAATQSWLRLVLLPIIPACGGVVVALLSKLGGGFPPGMRDIIKSADQLSLTDDYIDETGKTTATATINTATAPHPVFHQFRFVKKSLAGIVTLGTGCSLGPEGPSVEIGMNLSRLIMDIFPTRANDSQQERRDHSRLLLACGAAAGVSAGFNAPIAGAFFALEIMQQAFNSIDRENNRKRKHQSDLFSPTPGLLEGSISAVLLASVTSALVCQSLLGEHLLFALTHYTMRTPLMELPLYLLLGATSGLAAFFFSQASTWSRALFQGSLGPKNVRKLFTELPSMSKPAFGGLFCGTVGLVFPQILFCGYDTMVRV